MQLLDGLPRRRDRVARRERGRTRRNKPTESAQSCVDQQLADAVSNRAGSLGRACVPNVDAQHPLCRRQMGACRIRWKKWIPAASCSLKTERAPRRNDFVLQLEPRPRPAVGGFWRGNPEATADWKRIAVRDRELCYAISIRAHAVSEEVSSDVGCWSRWAYEKVEQRNQKNCSENPWNPPAHGKPLNVAAQ